MRKFLKVVVLGVSLSLFTARCATGPETDSGANEAEFSEFDKGADVVDNSDTSASDSATSESDDNSQPSEEAKSNTTSNENSLEQEIADAEGAPEAKDEQSADDMAQFEKVTNEEMPPPEVQPEPVPVVESSPPPPPLLVEQPTPVPPPEPPPLLPTEEPSAKAPQSKLVSIDRLQFKANDAGGTLAIEGNSPLEYSTRTNPNTHQFVIEIANAKLSKKAQRPLITKDFPGGIGSVDPYQAPGSRTARIVIQLREGAVEPTVQAEGNALLIVSPSLSPAPVNSAPPVIAVNSGKNGEGEASVSGAGSNADGSVEDPGLKSKILSSSSLQEFLAGNQKFYGKKISLEGKDTELKELFKFLSDESGVNMILSDEVKGRVSFRFRQVPWDQALVVLLQSKQLGYVRQGDILRITKIEDLRKEEEDYTKVVKAKQLLLPLVVRMIPVSYAKVDDVVKQVQPFLTERGKVVAENRTSAVVISDIEKSIERIQKLITSLDIAPSQVLIEGKIVEAKDTFQKFIGVNLGVAGDDVDLGTNSRGSARNLRLPMTNGISTSGGAASLNMSISALDFLGNLNATLSLGESTGEVRVLSSPRILTLHNEAAEINQSSELPIVMTTPGSNGNPPTTTVSFKTVTLKLNVTPQITNDASVILGVEMAREFPGEVSDAASGARPINKRAAKTKVIVRNGQTAVIGGIYQSDNSIAESRVPGLASIPVLGWLFKNQKTTQDKNELLIFLTPRIVGQADSGISVPPVLAPKAAESDTLKSSDQELDL